MRLMQIAIALDQLFNTLTERRMDLWIAAWQHWNNIKALSTVEEVLAYDVNGGWPT